MISCAPTVVPTVKECLDHVVGERHLRHVLASYQKYYNEVRTHLSLQKDAPVRRDACGTGRVRSSPILGGYTVNMFEFEFPTGTTVLDYMFVDQDLRLGMA
jgi:hypothetical protein